MRFTCYMATVISLALFSQPTLGINLENGTLKKKAAAADAPSGSGPTGGLIDDNLLKHLIKTTTIEDCDSDETKNAKS